MKDNYLSINDFLELNGIDIKDYDIYYNKPDKDMYIDNDKIKLESTLDLEKETFYDSYAFMEMFKVEELYKLMEIIRLCIEYHKQVDEIER